MDLPPSFDKLISHLEDVELTTVHGRITEVIGMLIRAIIPQVKMGELCLIKRAGEPLAAEVVGFTKDEVILSPLGDMKGIGPSSEVIPMRMPMHIKVGPELLGRVLNGLGQPLDEDTNGPLNVTETFPVIQAGVGKEISLKDALAVAGSNVAEISGIATADLVSVKEGVGYRIPVESVLPMAVDISKLMTNIQND